MFVIINALINVILIAPPVSHNAKLTVHILNVHSNVGSHVKNAQSHANMVVNIQSVIKSVLKYVIGNHANSLVKMNLSVATNVLDFVVKSAPRFAKLNLVINMMQTLLKFYLEVSKMKMQNLYYQKTVIMLLKNKP